MSNIFKIYVNNNNEDNENVLSDLYLFIKNKYFKDDLEESCEALNESYSESYIDFLESEIFNKHFVEDFNDLDINYLHTFRPKIHFINENIYFDDTIETIKLKLLMSLNNNTSYEELYLFSLINKDYSPYDMYSMLTSNNKVKLKSEVLNNYLMNINEQLKFKEKMGTKDIYEYEDILIDDLETINVYHPIGQSLDNKYAHYFVTNPFKFKRFNLDTKSALNNTLSTNNGSLLMNHKIINNTLYVSFFKQVFDFVDKNMREDLEYVIKLYFPLMAQQDILSYEQYRKQQNNLFERSQKQYNSKYFQKKNEVIDLFYNLYYNASPIKRKDVGIQEINFNIYSKINLNLSLDSLFKLLNSNKFIPYIKFNPGKRVENLYRLYCDKISKNNKKIPQLKREEILKISKLYGKSNTITFLLDDETNEFFNNIDSFIVEIDVHGTINVKIKLTTIMDIDLFTDTISGNINFVLNNIVELFPANANKVNKFTSLNDNNVEILSLDYKINYLQNFNNKLREIDEKKLKLCLYYIFNIPNESKNKTNNKEFRFKRVGNYNNEDAKTALIIENIKQMLSPNVIVRNIQKNFNIETEEEAKKIFEETINNLNKEQDEHNLHKLKIRNNPGFLIQMDNTSNDINVSIKNIDNIDYIPLINMYIDGLFKIIMEEYRESLNIDVDICKEPIRKNKKDEQAFVKDNDAVNIKELENVKLFNEVEAVNDELDVLSMSDDDEDNLMDILLDDMDEDEDINEDEDVPVDSINNTIISEKEDEDDNISLDSIYEDEDEDEDDDDYDESSIKKPKSKVNKSNVNKSKTKEVDSDDNDDNDDDDQGITLKKGKKGSETIFKGRLEEYEPKLYKKKFINTKANNHYENYSRVCQGMKQPVILNEDEKQAIDKEYPGFYDDRNTIKYSSIKGKDFYYICPNYWDLNRNSILTKEQVESGEYGKLRNPSGTNKQNIIDRKNELKPYIITREYKDKEMSEHCSVCCGSKITKKSGDKMKVCLADMEKIQNAVTKKKETSVSSDDDSDDYSDDYSDFEPKSKYVSEKDIKKIYILDNKKTLTQDKIGSLPLILSKFLQFNNSACTIPGDKPYLVSNIRCLLRYGVEYSEKQSFIASIADVYCKYNKISNTYSIDKFKQMILRAINIDKFVTYCNGNLTHIFLSKNITEEYLNNMQIDMKYNETDFYRKLDKENINHINLYKKIINSYENFRKYIKSPNHIIDYTYLWDIICKPNEQLFPNGMNLIILDITTEDITQNVKVICPKQSFSTEFVDDNKESILLVKNGDNYEPIYAIKNDIAKKIVPTYSFDYSKDEIELVEFKKVLNIIKDNINEKCLKKETSDTENYDFELNMNVSKMANILLKEQIEIEYQVMNYENKVIGLIVKNVIKEDFNSYFVPCYPSGYNEDLAIPYILMDDENIVYREYSKTKQTLEKIYEMSDQKIKVNPKYNIINDGLIVGILTNGDQFVSIEPPIMYSENSELPNFSEENYLVTENDIKVQTTYKKDTEREEMITNIKLETRFFDSFKNVFKNVLSLPSEKINKIKLAKIINDHSILYFDKLRLLYDELKVIGEKYIIFAEYDRKILNTIKYISSCINNEDCETDFCMKVEGSDICNLKIPKNNLISGKDNEDIYYLKLADEFIRFNKTKNIILLDEVSMDNQNVRYDINDNEIVILQSEINNELFSGNIIIKNKYENYTNYDTFLSDDEDEPLPAINTLKLDKNIFKPSSAQPKKKVTIKIPKLQLETIKEISKQAETVSDTKKSDTKIGEKDELNNDMKDFDYFLSEVSDSCNSKLNKKYRIREMGIKENFKIKDNLYETYFSLNNEDDYICTYELLLLILKHHFKDNESKLRNLDIENIKEILLEAYLKNEYSVALMTNNYQYTLNPMIGKYLEERLIPYYYNKKFDKTKINEDEYKSEYVIREIINNEKYYLTYIDYYLICKELKVPIIFINNSVISISSIKSDVDMKKYMLGVINNEGNDYYFIKLPNITVRSNKDNRLLHGEYNLMININNDVNNMNNMQKNILKSIESKEDNIMEGTIATHKTLLEKPVIRKYFISSKKTPINFKTSTKKPKTTTKKP